LIIIFLSPLHCFIIFTKSRSFIFLFLFLFLFSFLLLNCSGLFSIHGAHAHACMRTSLLSLLQQTNCFPSPPSLPFNFRVHFSLATLTLLNSPPFDSSALYSLCYSYIRFTHHSHRALPISCSPARCHFQGSALYMYIACPIKEDNKERVFEGRI